MVVVSMDSPILKHHMSLKHPLSSQPPNIHATLSARVTVCAKTVGRDRAPDWSLAQVHHGFTGGGAGPTSCIFERRGTARKRRWRLVGRGCAGGLGNGVARGCRERC